MGWFRNLGNERPWAQGCVISAAGVVLGGTSCFGFIFTLNSGSGNPTLSQAATNAATIVFGLSGFAVVVGLVWFIVGLVKAATKNRTPPPPPAAPVA